VKEKLLRGLKSMLLILPLIQVAASTIDAVADDDEAGDTAYGEYLASECVTCHLPQGAEDGIPSIVGWDEASFIAILKSYKAKERENPAMQLVTSNLGEKEMTALAAYFSKLEPKEN
jgi:cytochrome c